MKEAISTDAAPRAIGPYSQAGRSGPGLFCSGQIGLDPATGELVVGGVVAETERVLENLRAVLDAAGVSLDNVVLAPHALSMTEELYRDYYASVCQTLLTLMKGEIPSTTVNHSAASHPALRERLAHRVSAHAEGIRLSRISAT